MSFSVIRSRVSQQLSKTPTVKIYNNLKISRKFFTITPFKQASLSSTSTSTSTSTYSSLPPNRTGFITALKVGIFAAFTGVFAASSYATYAYTLEEVDEKTKTFRASNYSIEDNASTISKLQSAVMSAPAKAIDFYLDLRKKFEEQVRVYSEPLSDKLLPDLPPHLEDTIMTLVVDLNETLVHSDWKSEKGWRTFKRPGVNDFLAQLAQSYEIVVYSDHLPMYVDPILERLDENEFIAHRLSRAATLYRGGKYYKDLSKLNRDPRRVLYISGHALEQCLQPENCVQIKPWTTDDVNDTSLVDIIPFLEFVAQSAPPDVRSVIASYQGQDIAKEFIKRSKDHKRRLRQKQGGLH